MSRGVNMTMNTQNNDVGERGIYFNVDENVPEKQCPCGGGACIVFTSKTENNPGRKFYRCRVRMRRGGCGFFEWCDGAQTPSMQCSCGAGPCSVLTAKTEKNRGRQFYKCPLKQEEGACNFFKWCDEFNSGSNNSPVAAQNLSAMYDCTPSNSAKSGSWACYKCGMDGHWAKNCPKSSLSTIGSTCFNCGQAGHWANDCLYKTSGFGDNGAQTNASKNPDSNCDVFLPQCW